MKFETEVTKFLILSFILNFEVSDQSFDVTGMGGGGGGGGEARQNRFDCNNLINVRLFKTA